MSNKKLDNAVCDSEVHNSFAYGNVLS